MLAALQMVEFVTNRAAGDTESYGGGVLEDGGFADPLWVRELLIEADVLYIDAVRGGEPPCRISSS